MNRYVPIFQEHVSDGELELEQLIDSAGTLVLVLADAKGRRLKLSFDSYTAYRKLDEGDALLMLADMRKSGGTAKYFYRVEESDFLSWFNGERCDSSSSQPLVHFTVAALNDIVDVLAIDAPTVEIDGSLLRKI